MTEQHPITPPDDLQEQWKQEWLRVRPAMTPCIQWMLAKSAQWGADQELDACCEWLDDYLLAPKGAQLRGTRRPKLKSQAEEALDLIDRIEYNAMTKNSGNEKAWDLEELEGVRRALKRLQELEKHDD